MLGTHYLTICSKTVTVINHLKTIKEKLQPINYVVFIIIDDGNILTSIRKISFSTLELSVN